MKYVEFATDTGARDRSHAICVEQGLGGPTDITQFWFAFEESESGRTGSALIVADGHEDALSKVEQTQLKDEAALTDWRSRKRPAAEAEKRDDPALKARVITP